MTTASSATDDKSMEEVRAYVRAKGIMVRRVTLFEENQFFVYRHLLEYVLQSFRFQFSEESTLYHLILVRV